MRLSPRDQVVGGGATGDCQSLAGRKRVPVSDKLDGGRDGIPASQKPTQIASRVTKSTYVRCRKKQFIFRMRTTVLSLIGQLDPPTPTHLAGVHDDEVITGNNNTVRVGSNLSRGIAR
jgi:hypothetical protein